MAELWPGQACEHLEPFLFPCPPFQNFILKTKRMAFNLLEVGFVRKVNISSEATWDIFGGGLS